MRGDRTIAVSLGVIGTVLIAGYVINAPLQGAARHSSDAYQHRKSFVWLHQIAPGMDPQNCRENDPANDGLNVEDFVGLPLWCRDGAGRAAAKFTTAAGYNGPVELVIGLARDAGITGIGALRHDETAGFGSDILDPRHPWLQRFVGRSTADEIVSVDAVSGATFTSRAVTKAVARVIEAERNYRASGE